MATEAEDAEMLAEIGRDAETLGATFGRERTALLFSGEYDNGSAIISISAGAGGTEATDWAEMLLRMYLRWAERHRFKTEIVDQTEGEQTGLKSVTVEIDGRRAYGLLRAERGVHRLVRISPYDAQNRRQTTFALVEVLPEAGGRGRDRTRLGRHPRRTRTAARAPAVSMSTRPTRLCGSRTCPRTRRPEPERAAARPRTRRPRSGCSSRDSSSEPLEESEAETRQLKGEHVEAGWGNQIRSYVLHPYQMVKDHRTDHETANTTAVLDGDLDEFMQAEIEREATGAPVAGAGEPA